MKSIILLSILQVVLSKNETFKPTPISISVTDLPSPTNTSGQLNYASQIPIPADPVFYLPDGFVVKEFYADLKRPRYLHHSPEGHILVSESAVNRISCLIDNDKDGFPDERTTIADETNGLEYPYGMAFFNGFFYSGNRYNVRRYQWRNCSTQLTGTGEIIFSYPGERHLTRPIIISSSNDRIFVSIGSGTNVDIEPSPKGSIQVVQIDGSSNKTFASGLRNAAALSLHPVTKELYATCQERDEIGDDLVPDFFTRVEENDFYGWPYTYMTPNLVDPRHQYSNGSSIRPDLAILTKTPDVLFQAHTSVLGLNFYTGDQFPSKYRYGAFVASRASGNKKIPTGSKIMFVPFNQTTHRPLGYYEDFLKGFLINETTSAKAFGWPVGVLMLNDGSLLFSEDMNNVTYIVQYIGDKNRAMSLKSSLISFFIVILLISSFQ